MIITKEMFKNLKKKDQIEFSLKKKEVIGNIKPLYLFTKYIFWTIYISAFSMIVLPLWKLAFNYQTFIIIGRFFQALMQIMPFVIIVGLIIDVIVLLIAFLNLEKIKKEYFDVEIKVRRK